MSNKESLNDTFLNLHRSLCDLRESIDDISVNTNSESIEELKNQYESFNLISDLLAKKIENYLVRVVDEEYDEIVGEETENGVKL